MDNLVDEKLKIFKKKIKDFEGEFEFAGDSITINLTSFQRRLRLYFSYKKDNIPEHIKIFAETPAQLFQIIDKLEENQITIDEEGLLFICVRVAHKLKYINLPLEKQPIEELVTMKEMYKRLEQLCMDLKVKCQQLKKENQHLRLSIENACQNNKILDRYRELIERHNLQVQRQQQFYNYNGIYYESLHNLQYWKYYQNQQKLQYQQNQKLQQQQAQNEVQQAQDDDQQAQDEDQLVLTDSELLQISQIRLKESLRVCSFQQNEYFEVRDKSFIQRKEYIANSHRQLCSKIAVPSHGKYRATFFVKSYGQSSEIGTIAPIYVGLITQNRLKSGWSGGQNQKGSIAYSSDSSTKTGIIRINGKGLFASNANFYTCEGEIFILQVDMTLKRFAFRLNEDNKKVYEGELPSNFKVQKIYFFVSLASLQSRIKLI